MLIMFLRVLDRKQQILIGNNGGSNTFLDSGTQDVKKRTVAQRIPVVF